ncbi:MAG TPA: radical SAM protein [Gemmatimonadales bacterium]|nr:radical SAM protein [Gemmatimonadales bacterium]
MTTTGGAAMKGVLDLKSKLQILMALAAGDRDGPPPRLRHAQKVGALGPLNIRNLRPGPGRQTSLLRVLMTNACSFNCHYCPMRRDREMPRTLLKPEELVRIFLEARRRGWCEGLFITTGIPGRPVKVVDDLIQALELLRERHRFDGYIHVKLVPGAEASQIERLTALASRVSLNLEAPCGATLARIAPEKSLPVTLGDLERVRALVLQERMARGAGRPRDPLHPGGVSGMTMQFVVGATPDTDRTILDTVSRLQHGGGLHHAHFSAFRPITDTPMENLPATPVLREHRLYQAEYLLRDYGFAADEVVFGPGGNLPLAMDPKSAWALAHPERFPVEVSRASYEELVRVPGIGPLAARRIVAQRASTSLRGLSDLRGLGVVTTRAGGFLTLRGRRLQTTRWTEQLGFWAPEDEVGVHHVLYEVSPGTFR